MLPMSTHPELSGCITTLIVRNANFGAAMDTFRDEDDVLPNNENKSVRSILLPNINEISVLEQKHNIYLWNH